MKKQIPNLISCSRIVFALLLLIEGPDWFFYACYIYVGLSDVADGLIARRFHLTSPLGARLDSISDGVFFLIYFMVFGSDILKLMSELAVIAIIAMVLMRFLSLYMSRIKHEKFLTYHTLSNKMTGGLVYLLPFFLKSDKIMPILWLTLIVGLLAAVEEVLLMASSTTFQADRKSLFLPWKSDRLES